jgi:hypothetical protein
VTTTSARPWTSPTSRRSGSGKINGVAIDFNLRWFWTAYFFNRIGQERM